MAALVGHYFGTLAITTCQVQIADNAAFDSNLQTVADFGAQSTDDRDIDLVLEHGGGSALRYSSVRYVRLKLVAPGNVTPQLGELILGRRRQLKYKPDVPFDNQAYVNEEETTRSQGGVTQRVIYHRNRLRIDAAWVIDTSDYITDWRAFWAACRGPFLWCYAPTSAPASWSYMIRDMEEIDFPLTGPTKREAKLVADEQGPEAYFLANE